MNGVGLWLVLQGHTHSPDAALGSVAAQTVPPYEVVVVDDGSTGDLVTSATRWSGRLPLRVVHHEPGRPGGATATAARCSEAAWVAQLHVEDSWLPDHLSTLVPATEGGDVIVSPRELDWDPTSGVAIHDSPARVLPAGTAQRFTILERNFVSRHALFPRALYERIGGHRVELRESADWDLWIRMVRAGAHVLTADHATVLRRSGTVDSRRDASLECDCEVVRRAIAEATDESERSRAAATLRRLESRVEFGRSVDEARIGRTWAARRSALAALRDGGRSTPMAWLMAIAPQSALRLDDRLEARRNDRRTR
jgi:glycosyltransferase involved in cell wall biosynthesis